MRNLAVCLVVALALLCVPTVANAQQTRTATLNYTDTSNPTGTTYNAYRLTGTCPGTIVLSAFTKVNTAPITAKTYADSGLTPGTYCYVVTAVNSTLESGPSNSVSGVAQPFPPVPPTGLTVTIAKVIQVVIPPFKNGR